MSDTQERDEDWLKEISSGVVPLAQDGRVLHRRRDVATPGQLYSREAAQRPLGMDLNPLTTEFVEYVDPQSTLSFRREGVQQGVFRKLQQGGYRIEAAVDLHKQSVEQARKTVYDFVCHCVEHDVRLALMTHGKGGREPGKPAYIKSYVARWLPRFAEIMAYHSAQPWHGGTGAVYILFRKSEKQKALTREKLGLTSGKPE
ncbi:MAG: endonuclease SmrA [Pseudomonadota bacterium]